MVRCESSPALESRDPHMAVGDPPAFHGDLILRTRPGWNTRTGQMETRYWLDSIGKARWMPFPTHADAVAAGRLRAEMEGVTLWEDITSALARANDMRLRLEVSFRRLSSGGSVI